MANVKIEDEDMQEAAGDTIPYWKNEEEEDFP